MSSLFYFFKESLTGFTRNLSTTLGAIITIFLSLLIIGVFLVGGSIVNNIVSSIEDVVSITAYVADDANDATVKEVSDFIRGLDSVASVSFTTKEQALENFQSTSSSDIIDSLDGANPLPASIDVELSDPQQVETVAQAIKDNADYQSIADEGDVEASVRYGQQSIDRLFSMTNYIRYVGIALVALLIFIAFVFINNTIRLAILARRKEIALMRLVGASNGFIRGPFLMEGALHALIGAALAIGCVELLRRLALPEVANALVWLPVNVETRTVLIIYLGLLVAGLVIGLLGSALAMRRYLKV